MTGANQRTSKSRSRYSRGGIPLGPVQLNDPYVPLVMWSDGRQGGIARYTVGRPIRSSLHCPATSHLSLGHRRAAHPRSHATIELAMREVGHSTSSLLSDASTLAAQSPLQVKASSHSQRDGRESLTTLGQAPSRV